MNLFKVKSIKNQIISIIMLVTIPLIIVTTLLLAFFTINSFKKSQKRHAINTANFVTAQVSTAMLFADNKRGNDILSNFKNEESIEAAYILNFDKTTFAKFEKSKKQKVITFKEKMPYAIFKNNKLFIATDINYDKNEKPAVLYIIMNTNRMNKTIKLSIIMMAIALLLMIILTYFFASRSQRFISDPILALADFAKSINDNSSKEKRIIVSGTDEISTLYNRFNNMLDRISERDQKLQSASEFLLDILNSSPSLLIVINENENITLNNFKVNDYLDQKDVIGLNIWDLLPQLQEFKDKIKSTISSNDDFDIRGVSFKLKHIKNADISIFSLTKTQERGTVISITDVTDVTEKEKQLIQIQKMETVGTLAGGLAHDFNNVMGGITGIVSLIELKIDKGISKENLKEYIDIIKEASDRAINMVRQLLSLSYKSETNFKNINLIKSINSVVTILRNSIDKSVQIDTNINKEEAIVLADSAQLEQIFLNIAINAAHSMTLMQKDNKLKGGLLSIVVDNLKLEDREKQNIPAGRYHHISISDNGVGIPDSIKDKMFEPFFTTKAKGKGTGLGLSMVYNIVKQHKGHIVVETQLEVGTSFHIFLPKISEDILFEDINDSIDAKFLNQKGTILIIDDEDYIRFTARKILEECGYTVFDFSNGKDGIEFFSKNYSTIDLVLLDLAMPNMSGEDVFPKLDKISKDSLILLSSGFKQDERVQKLLDLGVNGFIHKPYTFIKLSTKVFNMINPSANHIS